MRKKMIRKKIIIFACIIAAILGFSGCAAEQNATGSESLFGNKVEINNGVGDHQVEGSSESSDSESVGLFGEGLASSFEQSPGSDGGSTVDLAQIPEFSGESYIEVNGNVPAFSDADKAVPFGTEVYGDLDELGRCTVAFAMVGRETQPTSKRGNISDVKPTGWKQNLDLYSLGLNHLYERSHLIAHKLTAEDANKKNLITGTYYLNQGAMSRFETIVGDHVDATGGHVLMRVTPVFYGDELVARGVQMEAYSLEDEGQSVLFNVFCYNVQPGVEIDYATGASRVI